jgi:hypothetical protein
LVEIPLGVLFKKTDP